MCYMGTFATEIVSVKNKVNNKNRKRVWHEQSDEQFPAAHGSHGKTNSLCVSNLLMDGLTVEKKGKQGTKICVKTFECAKF